MIFEALQRQGLICPVRAMICASCAVCKTQQIAQPSALNLTAALLLDRRVCRQLGVSAATNVWT